MAAVGGFPGADHRREFDVVAGGRSRLELDAEPGVEDVTVEELLALLEPVDGWLNVPPPVVEGE